MFIKLLPVPAPTRAFIHRLLQVAIVLSVAAVCRVEKEPEDYNGLLIALSRCSSEDSRLLVDQVCCLVNRPFEGCRTHEFPTTSHLAVPIVPKILGKYVHEFHDHFGSAFFFSFVSLGDGWRNCDAQVVPSLRLVRRFVKTTR